MIKGLTVEQLREAKHTMEINILDSIREEILRFSKRTGVGVENIELTFVNVATTDPVLATATHKLVNVQTTVSLEAE
jgi:hypothetical protein